ncbi:MAG TPA: site-specific integrase [Thermomicrobiales bacterium]
MPQKPYRIPGRALWYIRIELPPSPDGKSRQRTVSGVTRKEVVEKQVALLRELHAGTALEPSTLTVGEYLTRWVEEVVRPSRAVRTYEGRESMIRLHLIPHLGGVLLAKLQPAHISAMLAAIQRDKSAKTALDSRTVLHTALNHAVRKWQLLPQNPVDRVDPPRYEPEPPALWDEAQLRRFLAGNRDYRHSVLYRLALDTGLRQAELLGLRWADVDLAHRLLSVRRQSIKTQTQGYITTPTKGRRGRSVALTPGTVAALVAHRAAQDAERAAAGAAWRDEDRIFPNRTGGRSRRRTSTTPGRARSAGSACRTSGSTACATCTPPTC